jgi:hypothetical protein
MHPPSVMPPDHIVHPSGFGRVQFGDLLDQVGSLRSAQVALPQVRVILINLITMRSGFIDWEQARMSR